MLKYRNKNIDETEIPTKAAGRNRYEFGCDDFGSSLDKPSHLQEDNQSKGKMKSPTSRRTKFSANTCFSPQKTVSTFENSSETTTAHDNGKNSETRKNTVAGSPRSPLVAVPNSMVVEDRSKNRYGNAHQFGHSPYGSELDEDILKDEVPLDESDDDDYYTRRRIATTPSPVCKQNKNENEVDEEHSDRYGSSDSDEYEGKPSLKWKGRILPKMSQLGAAGTVDKQGLMRSPSPGEESEDLTDSLRHEMYAVPDTPPSTQPSPSAPPLTNSVLDEGGSPETPQHVQTYRMWSAGGGSDGKHQAPWPSHILQTPPRSPRASIARSVEYYRMKTPDSCTTSGPSVPLSAPYSYSSCLEAWPAMVAYDGCVRVCLHAAENGCHEAEQFLSDGAVLLRNTLGLQQVLLQPGQGVKQVHGGGEDGRSDTPAKTQARRRSSGVVKLQVKKVKLNKAGQTATPTTPRSASKGSVGLMWQMSEKLKDKMNLRAGNADMTSQDGLLCDVRLKSMSPEESHRMVPGNEETVSLHPENTSDELLIQVFDSKGLRGSAVIPVTAINDDQVDKTKWVPILCDGEAEPVGRIQLAGSYSAMMDWATKGGGIVAETLAYDTILEVALRMQGFQRRQLYLKGPWHWLLNTFAATYGVSESYKSLRYLSHIMDVATPTEDCLLLLYDLLAPIVKARVQDTLTRQERRMLADIEDSVKLLLIHAFENYKVLDDAAPSGLSDAFILPAGTAGPALSPAVMLFALLYDVLLPEAQNTLKYYFQTAARKRCRRHLAETDELLQPPGALLDALAASPAAPAGAAASSPGVPPSLEPPWSEAKEANAYGRMRACCVALSNEIRSDIGIQHKHIFPSFIDLPSLTAEVYAVELNTRLRVFLRACPARRPNQPVADLLHAAADLQHDLTQWGIRPVPGWLDARDLFGFYIEDWVHILRNELLELCKNDKARWAPSDPQSEPHATSPFVEEMYARIFDVLAMYDSIMGRWPEFTVSLENAICDVERGLMAALERSFNDQLLPLRDIMKGTPKKKFSLSKLTNTLGGRYSKGGLYQVPPQLGVLLNTIKRLLETLRPQVEATMRMWVAGLPNETQPFGRAAFGERLAEVTVELRAKYRNTLQGIIEKILENAHMNRNTHLKRILQDTKAQSGDDMCKRMQPLVDLLGETLAQLDSVLSPRVFVGAVRGFWDRLARQVLNFLENRKENMSWFKSASAGIALEILDNSFTSHMQRLQGHSLQEKDLEPPRGVLEARAMLSKEVPNGTTDSYALF